MNYKQEFNALKKYAKMKSEEDIKLFDIMVYELAKTQDLGVFERLIDIFDDECEFPEVMYSLIHAIATYPCKQYVLGILSKVNDYYKYVEWFKIIIYGILNSEKYLEVFKHNIHLANQDKLLKLLNIMHKESEDHHLIIEELRNLIVKN